MKNMIRILFVLLAVIFAYAAYTNAQNTTISGKVIPEDGVDRVWAVNQTDSVFVVPDKGIFVLQVKPGVHKIIVIAKPPYQNLEMDNIPTEEGKNTDVGELRLIQ